MKGKHLVRSFTFHTHQLDLEQELPEGWKPFGVVDTGSKFGMVTVIARKWVRST